MRHVTSYPLTRPPLVCGKGPSIKRFFDVDHKSYTTVGINQVSFKLPTDVGHFIDYEAWTSHTSRLPPAVWMPFEPHFRERGGHGNIEIFRTHDAFLRHANLYCYDLFGSPMIPTYELGFPDKQNVYANRSTAEATIHILSMLGAKEIFTLGIDGGTDRFGAFSSDYRREAVDYSLQKPCIDELAEVLGLTITAL